jgi:hypothetical protein
MIVTIRFLELGWPSFKDGSGTASAADIFSPSDGRAMIGKNGISRNDKDVEST